MVSSILPVFDACSASPFWVMSALLPKADIHQRIEHAPAFAAVSANIEARI